VQQGLQTMSKEFKQLDAGAMPGKPVVGKAHPDFFIFQGDEASSRSCESHNGETK